MNIIFDKSTAADLAEIKELCADQEEVTHFVKVEFTVRNDDTDALVVVWAEAYGEDQIECVSTDNVAWIALKQSFEELADWYFMSARSLEIVEA